jgi:protein SCO1/2
MAASLARSFAALALVLVCLLASSGAATARDPRFVGPTIAHPMVAPDFALRDQTGHVIRLSAERGKVVMITFLYTHCPDSCPLTATHISEALARLGPRSKDVIALAVSVDPHGDTPTAVRAFVRSHRLGPQFHYLTGSAQALGRIWRLYDITHFRPGGPVPGHTLYVLLLDRAGRTRVLFDSLAKPAAMAHDLGVLLG